MRKILIALVVFVCRAQDGPPSAEQQAAMIADVRRHALDYNKGLADFLCTQTTRRSFAKLDAQNLDWKLEDTLTIRLSYVQHRENYRVIRINDKAVDKTLEKVGGHQTRGEFGSNLWHVMAVESGGQFKWEEWSQMNGRPTAVFSYRIPYAQSPFRTFVHRPLHSQTCKWGVEGELEIDRERKQILKLSIHSADVPAACPMKTVGEVISYGMVSIGEAQFLLPLQSESVVEINGRKVKAETNFTDYRKFSAASDIKFEQP